MSVNPKEVIDELFDFGSPILDCVSEYNYYSTLKTEEVNKAEIRRLEKEFRHYRFKMPVHLVPQTAWGQNLRTKITSKQWQAVRAMTIRASKRRCYYCGADYRGKSHQLHAHEVWHWNIETFTQSLVATVATCEDCHLVLHWGYANTQGKLPFAIAQFCKVNGINYNEQDFQPIYNIVHDLWEKRSLFYWELNIQKELDFLEKLGV